MRPPAMTLRSIRIPSLILALLPVLMACDSDPRGATDERCNIPTGLLFQSVPLDAIPALTDPLLVGADEADYLADSDLVLGLLLDDLTVAVPHNILWWHEVINFNSTAPPVAVTFCPLTGSGIAFDRSVIGNAEFGVSGLIFLNNNVIYDRREPRSLWSQMRTEGICFDEVGTSLPTVPLLEMTWGGWRALHPETRVLSDSTGFERNYRVDPLARYKQLNNFEVLFPMASIDVRRPPKERVLGIPDGLAGLAFPFLILDDGSPIRAIHESVGGQPLVVFFDPERQAAAAYRLTGADAGRRFEVRDGKIVDTDTESTWEVDGRATGGPREGAHLTPVPDAYVSYWFAWEAFQPGTEIWGE